MVYLFPKIMPIFTSLHSKLPLSTKIVIALSTFFQQWGWLVVVLIILAIIAYVVVMKRSVAMRFRRDEALLRMPVIGTMVQSYNCANGCRTIGLLLKSGITLSEALPITADTTRNLAYRARYRELGDAVIRGEALSQHFLTNRAYFPDMIGHLVAVGERSGSLSNTLVYLSELYDTEVDDFTKNLSTLIEPALMVFMGIIIGFIAISIITPIYGITQNLHG
jgi:type IV pilus assembly protein PilC